MVCFVLNCLKSIANFITERLESKRVRSAAYLEDASSSDSSPVPSPTAQLTLETQRKRSHNRSPSRIPTIKTPLLMPPPATLMSTFKHRISLCQHYVFSWATLNQQMLLLLIKILIFLIKLLSITRPCLPIATRQSVYYSLAGLAALELALGAKTSWRVVSMFAAIHVTIVFGVVKWGDGMCERRGLHEQWNETEQAWVGNIL